MRTIATEELHGWAIAQRIQLLSNNGLQVKQGSLYLALQRLNRQGWITADWAVSENNRPPDPSTSIGSMLSPSSQSSRL
jgi:PadR family transcriptional regulator PadR